MMSSEGRQKRKSKSWYRRQAYQNKRRRTDGKPSHHLVAGLKGFLITCNDHERDAVKEAYNILSEYADMLYGAEAWQTAECEGSTDEDDLEKTIAGEVQTMKTDAASGQRRFQNSWTGTKIVSS